MDCGVAASSHVLVEKSAIEHHDGKLITLLIFPAHIGLDAVSC